MKNIIKILIVGGLLVLSVSCFRDRNADGGSGAKTVGEAQIMLRLKVPAGFNGQGTRASLTAAAESKIHDVHVLIFDLDGGDAYNNLVAVRRGNNISQTDGSFSANFVITVPVDEDDDDEYGITVIANAGGIITDKLAGWIDTETIAGTHTYATVMATLCGDITGTSVTGAGQIAMWGEKKSQLTVVELVDVSLLRSVARVDVGVGRAKQKSGGGNFEYEWDGMVGGVAVPLELEEVYIVKPNNKYLIAPVHGNLAGDALKALAPSVPSGAGQAGVPMVDDDLPCFLYEVPNKLYTTQEIYIAEANVKMGADGFIRDGNHTNRSAIVVGGEYNESGGTTYYRIDFSKGSDAEGGSGRLLTDVLRNHLYQVSIIGVRGPGQPTVKEAYESQGSDMTIEIIDWNEEDIWKDL